MWDLLRILTIALFLGTCYYAPELAAAVFFDVAEVAGAVITEWMTESLQLPAPAEPAAPSK